MLRSCTKKPTLQAFFIALGVFFEWYDFTLYFYLGSILSNIFFHDHLNQTNRLIYFAIFAIAYVCRPIGGIIFGRLSDHLGRRQSLLLAMKCMFLSSLGIAFLPTYTHIGVFASILLLFLRALQGISIGGEYTGVLTLIFEGSNNNKEGTLLSLIGVVSCLGQMASACFLFLLMHYTSHEFMMQFGWRICFLVGAVGMAVVYFFQSAVPESPAFLQAKHKGKLKDRPIAYALKHYRPSVILVFLLTGTLGIVYVLYFISIPDALIHDLHYPQNTIHLIIILATALQVAFYPIGGWLSDRYGPTRILLIIFTLAVLTIYPCNTYIMHHLAPFGYCFYLGYIMLFSVATPSFLLLINQQFPVYCRASGVFIGYNISNALFSSITPSVCVLFTDGVFSIGVASTLTIVFLLMCLLILLTSSVVKNKPYLDELDLHQSQLALSER